MSEDLQIVQPESDSIEQAITTSGNGIINFSPNMSDEELLAELSAETIGPSYGYVHLKVTQGDVVRYVKIKVQPIDAIRLGNEPDRMTKQQTKDVLAYTASLRSAAFNDEVWLQTLGAACFALAPPHTLKNAAGEIVWVANGSPQRLPDAMKAWKDIGFVFWHIEEIANHAIRMNRDLVQREEGLSGNS